MHVTNLQTYHLLSTNKRYILTYSCVLFVDGIRFPLLTKILRGIANNKNPTEIIKAILSGKKLKVKTKKNKSENEENKEEEENETEEKDKTDP